MSKETRTSRFWRFTLKNLSQIKDLNSETCQYAIYTIKNDEIKGYVEFKANKRLAAVKKVIPTAKWEIKTGTREDEREEFLKLENKYIETGTWIAPYSLRPKPKFPEKKSTTNANKKSKTKAEEKAEK